MAELKTANLEGLALDWAVAKSIGWVNYPEDSVEHGKIWHIEPTKAPFGRIMSAESWKPSTTWAQGGPLLVEHDIIFRKYHRPDSPDHGKYYAMVHRDSGQIVHWSRRTSLTGPTPLIAAMRCLVAYGLGDTIDIPEELL
ncbi:conserved hypothetical protein [Pseudomonas sp. OF001]|uniref:phage protein NinX family protein n=1 Tax=Pseudomonas sp. OF001 TaxID=2772300 RepID=UPI0019198009|nr:phage protein NinX family protein [Pseudomonas sp. OF001]CAD5377320.1 conserved hypothetical protein [Pseudomonas sp. OF001]